jgi:hypothetical protein
MNEISPRMLPANDAYCGPIWRWFKWPIDVNDGDGLNSLRNAAIAATVHERSSVNFRDNAHDKCPSLLGKSDANRRAPEGPPCWSHDLAQLSTAWAEMNVGHGCFQVALAPLNLILVNFQSALLATLCGDCEWLGLASTEALHSAIIAAISSVGDELAMELICEIRAMDRDKHDFVLLAK